MGGGIFLQNFHFLQKQVVMCLKTKTKTSNRCGLWCKSVVSLILCVANILRKVSDSLNWLHLFIKAPLQSHRCLAKCFLAGGGFGFSISAGHCNAWTIWEKRKWQYNLKDKCPSGGGGCFPSDAQVTRMLSLCWMVDFC